MGTKPSRRKLNRRISENNRNIYTKKTRINQQTMCNFLMGNESTRGSLCPTGEAPYALWCMGLQRAKHAHGNCSPDLFFDRFLPDLKISRIVKKYYMQAFTFLQHNPQLSNMPLDLLLAFIPSETIFLISVFLRSRDTKEDI